MGWHLPDFTSVFATLSFLTTSHAHVTFLLRFQSVQDSFRLDVFSLLFQAARGHLADF